MVDRGRNQTSIALKGTIEVSEFIPGMLIALIPALAVSIITAYVTVRLSLKRFYSQRWWDKKAEAYSQILEQLSYLKYYYDEWLDELQAGITIGTDHKKRLSVGYQQSKESITRAAAVGEFIVSETTTQALSKLLSEIFWHHFEEDFNAAVQKSYDAVAECIRIVKGDAKEALLRMMH